MTTQTLYRGRLIDHVHLVVRDLDKSRRFYAGALSSLGIAIGGEGPGFFWVDELFVSTTQASATGELTGRHHLAFQAASRDAVDAFFKAALAAGGTDNGAPGERPYHPGYYACFVKDPDGNNVEAVFHGAPESRSAAAIEIKLRG